MRIVPMDLSYSRCVDTPQRDRYAVTKRGTNVRITRYWCGSELSAVNIEAAALGGVIEMLTEASVAGSEREEGRS